MLFPVASPPRTPDAIEVRFCARLWMAPVLGVAPGATWPACCEAALVSWVAMVWAKCRAKSVPVVVFVVEAAAVAAAAAAGEGDAGSGTPISGSGTVDVLEEAAFALSRLSSAALFKAVWCAARCLSRRSAGRPVLVTAAERVIGAWMTVGVVVVVVVAGVCGAGVTFAACDAGNGDGDGDVDDDNDDACALVVTNVLLAVNSVLVSSPNESINSWGACGPPMLTDALTPGAFRRSARPGMFNALAKFAFKLAPLGAVTSLLFPVPLGAGVVVFTGFTADVVAARTPLSGMGMLALAMMAAVWSAPWDIGTFPNATGGMPDSTMWVGRLGYESTVALMSGVMMLSMNSCGYSCCLHLDSASRIASFSCALNLFSWFGNSMLAFTALTYVSSDAGVLPW